MANPTDTIDAEPHDPRLLALTLDATTISEIVAARTPNEGAKIIRKKSRVVGGFPEGLAEQLMGQLAELSAHDYRQIEAAVAMAIYGSSSEKMRKRLAHRRLDFRICCDGVEPGCFQENQVDDLAIGDDEDGGSTGSNAVQSECWRWRKANGRCGTTSARFSVWRR